jgi:hypothetical protein
MSQKKSKKARFAARIESDLKFANGGKMDLDFYVRELPPGKAMLVECVAVDERTLKLPKELGGKEVKLSVSYAKPADGRMALVIAKKESGEVEYGVRSTRVFDKKNTLLFDPSEGVFFN